MTLVVKNPCANAGDRRDISSILGRKDPLQQEMATHSSILAWRIPRTEEPGGLQYMESHRVGHDWATEFFHPENDVKSSSTGNSLVVQWLGLWAPNARGPGSIPGLGRSPGEGNGNPLQYLCLGIPKNRQAWRATELGLQRVGHDWRDLAHTHAFLKFRCIHWGLILDRKISHSL